MKHNFLIIGERCQDVFIYGSAKRLSPEAPVPVFVPQRTISNEGMARNVYHNLVALIDSHDVNLENNVSASVSINSAEKIRYVDEKTNHYFLRVDNADNSYDRIVFHDQLLNKIQSANTIIISDYNKGFLQEEDIIDICVHSNTKCTIFLDSKKVLTEDILACVDFVKMNEKEYEINHEAIGLILYEYEKKIIMTQGNKGASYMDCPYETDSVVTMDVSGAGDTFMASLAYKYSTSYDIVDSIKFANKMASEVVKKRGVSTI
jgi:bifunctional ADP-heptose synthase (sugar kinase/adenylyltransferase)